ncbi:MAG: efflux RND transporter periplasmic adaptor subunit [Verrucomicrobiota bacterium]|jgi:RND family efflux transporter MFP subunit
MSNEEPKGEPLIPPVPSGGRSGEAPPPRLIVPPAPPGRRRRNAWIAGITVAGIVILCLCLLRRSSGLAGAASMAIRTAAVATVGREDLHRDVEIPAEFRPYVEVELHAKVSGYLQKINVDFGDRVKAGQLLAVLEVPELKDELDSAIAAEQRAEADYKDAHLIHQRLVRVNKEHPNLVAQQDIDTAEAKDNVARAAVSAAKADVEKYQTLFGYTQITAPFDGVITRRYADPGVLIQAGTSSGQAKAVVRVSDNYHLRLDFPVSVEYVKYIKEGDRVEARVDSLGGKMYSGVITRFTHEVNEETRTMTTEIEVTNPDLELTPGMYAAVMLKVEKRPSALAVPIEAVSSGGKPTVYLLNGNNEIEERAVTLGMETATRYEILSGLKEGDKVVIGSRSEFHPGEKVEPKPVQAPALAES